MDLIANGSEDGPDFVELDVDQDLTWGHPAALAITSIVLSGFILFGISLLRGSLYVGMFESVRSLNDNGNGDKNLLITAAFISVAFALIPLFLARFGLYRLVPSDGAWTAHLLRAAFMLSAVGVVLRLALALMVTFHDPGITGLTFQE